MFLWNYPQQWAVLFKNSINTVPMYCSSYTLKRNRKYTFFSWRWRLQSSGQILLEKYFGMIYGLFSFLLHMCLWAEELYDAIFGSIWKSATQSLIEIHIVPKTDTISVVSMTWLTYSGNRRPKSYNVIRFRIQIAADGIWTFNFRAVLGRRTRLLKTLISKVSWTLLIYIDSVLFFSFRKYDFI